MTREDVIRRGEASARLLDDPLVMAALAEITNECAATWANSNPQDAAAREDAYRLHRCAQLLRQRLEAWAASAVVEKGNMAARVKEANTGLTVAA
jgi:hypothetical protein